MEAVILTCEDHRSTSSGGFSRMVGITACESKVTSHDDPSGAAFATASVPISALPPGRFSTTNCCPVLAVIACARLRAMMSVPPLGAKGTIRRTDFVGYIEVVLTAAL